MRIAMLLLIYLTNFAMFGILFFGFPSLWLPGARGRACPSAVQLWRLLPIGSSAQAFAGQFKDVARATPGRRRNL
ncbi:MAG TPA: hypothetical protein DDY43_06800 [Synechococcales bacterium UBA10510]|nr:hypothetical protein [Synechococcales bacterium UBA10510]